jgi:hypothetical protein
LTTLLVVVMSCDWHAGHCAGRMVTGSGITALGLSGYLTLFSLYLRRLHLETEAPQAGNQLGLDHFAEMIEPHGTALKLAAPTVIVPGAEHGHTIADPADRRLYGRALGERRPQFLDGALHVPIGIGGQPAGEVRDARQSGIDFVELCLHGHRHGLRRACRPTDPSRLPDARRDESARDRRYGHGGEAIRPADQANVAVLSATPAFL